jgi:Tfp pilus assembly protein PilP
MRTVMRERMAGLAVAAATCAALLTPPPAAGQTAPAQGQPPAQPPAAAGKPAPAAPAAASASSPAQPPENYSYNPEGRRDPFVSLVSRGLEATSAGKRGEGLAGLMTGEIAVRGVLQTQGSYVAIVQGPDMKTYIVHTNDHLVDGTVRSIGPQGLVILQEVNDPLSLIKQREVRKGLRATDEGK